MRISLITNRVSPHLIPLAREIICYVGRENFRFISEELITPARYRLGWANNLAEDWIIVRNTSSANERDALEWERKSDVIISGIRDLKLFRERHLEGLITLYMSERIFKPPIGVFRLFYLPFFFDAFGLARLLETPRFYYLPISMYAASDMERLRKIFRGELHYLFKPIAIEAISNTPCSEFRYIEKHCEQSINENFSLVDERHKNVSNFRLWGYFVDRTDISKENTSRRFRPLKVLWVGRMLVWKRVDTLICAVKELISLGLDIELYIIGSGPMEKRLKRIANRKRKFKLENSPIRFLPPLPIEDIRTFMNQSDVYVLPSNSQEGWGAVVNEAMEEECAIIATRQAGSAITMIKDGFNGLLFEAGNKGELKACLIRLYNDQDFLVRLQANAKKTLIQFWGVDCGAKSLMSFIKTIYVNP